MPLILNKHQPYFPDIDSPNNYNCNAERYCHLLQPGDDFYAQFNQTPCSDNLVCNGNFETYTEIELICNPNFATANQSCWLTNLNSQPMPTTYPGSLNGWANVLGGGITHLAGGQYGLYQNNIGTTYQAITKFKFIFDYNAGFVYAWIGNPTNGGYKKDFSALNSTSNINTYEELFLFNDNTNDFFWIQPGYGLPPPNAINGIFEGSIYTASVKQYFFDCWDINASWIIDSENKWAYHITGTTGDLVNNTANYVLSGGYYKASVTISDYVAGSVDFYVSDVLAGTISANGVYEFYINPTIDGTIKFTPTSDFVANIYNIEVYKLQQDHSAVIQDSNGNEFDITSYLNYYNEFVTLNFDFATVGNYELPTDCYIVKVYDQCLFEGNNLVLNGNFFNGYLDWTRNNGNAQYDIVADQLVFKFDPFSQGFDQYVTDGDFNTPGLYWNTYGSPFWFLGGSGAQHLVGGTTPMVQTLTLPTPPVGTNYTYWLKFEIRSWVQGTINVKLGNDPTGTNYTWKGNDTFVQIYTPKQSGSVDITFTPSIDFFGIIDSVRVVKTNGHTAFPIITNAVQPLFTPGTYQTEWDIISSSDPNISTRFYLQSASPTPPYQSDIGLQSYTQNFNLNGGNVIGVANFGKTSVDYSQINYVIGEITVDNISVVKVEPYEATYTTECLSYNESGWDRTKMIVAYCDQNAFGFEFENTGFKLQQRALIRSINPTYPKEKQIQKSGTGNARVVYSEIEKYWEVHTDFASETFHDCLSVQVDCDHFGIGDTQDDFKEYIADTDSYQPNWNGDGAYSLATAVINLRIKDKGQLFNRHI